MPIDNLAILNTIPTQLRLIRKARGLSQLDLMKKSGLSNSLISDIERGQSSPSLKSLLILCDALEIHLQDLLEHPESLIPRTNPDGSILICSNLFYKSQDNPLPDQLTLVYKINGDVLVDKINATYIMEENNHDESD